MRESGLDENDPNRLGFLGTYTEWQGARMKRTTHLKIYAITHSTLHSRLHLALASLGVNDQAAAISWLEQGYQDRDGENIGKIRAIRS